MGSGAGTLGGASVPFVCVPILPSPNFLIDLSARANGAHRCPWCAPPQLPQHRSHLLRISAWSLKVAHSDVSTSAPTDCDKPRQPRSATVVLIVIATRSGEMVSSTASAGAAVYCCAKDEQWKTQASRERWLDRTDARGPIGYHQSLLPIPSNSESRKIVLLRYQSDKSQIGVIGILSVYGRMLPASYIIPL